MAQSVITHAFETWNVQRVLDGVAARPDKVVFARIPGQDESVPVDRNEGLPPADQIQHIATITQAGVLNENAVVYSVVLDTTVGDWDYNWIGLLDSQTNTVLMIVHVRTQQKLATRNGQQGNSLTRNLMMQFDGAAAATQINVTADTWQIDFSTRLAGIDERIRIENMDRHGSSAFFGNAYQVVKDGNAYVVKAGVAYAAGLRTSLSRDLKITVDALPTRVFLDVCWRGEFTQAWAVDSQIVVANSADHEIRDGVQHYLLPVADIDENGNITDWRKQGSLAEQNAQTLYLRKDDNLAALRDKEASRKNLGLGQLAVMDTDTARQTLRITQLENELVGIPLPYPGATAPDGWLKCNGQSFNKSMYPLLAGRYPSGFLPDLRGEFIRGWDDGRGVDVGRGLLSAQTQAIQDHRHVGTMVNSNPLQTGMNTGIGLLSQYTPTPTVGYSNEISSGGTVDGSIETRPRNIAFNYIVRAA